MNKNNQVKVIFYYRLIDKNFIIKSKIYYRINLIFNEAIIDSLYAMKDKIFDINNL